VHIPDHINEINHKIIDAELLDLSNDMLRDQFFAGVINAHDNEIYGFGYATADGDYYGARRNRAGQIEVMKNNSETGGQSWYYSVKEDLTANELVLKSDFYDARSSDWYLAAKKSGQPTMSPIYEHSVMNDLAVTAAWPIYTSGGELKGVMGAHIMLTEIESYLSNAVKEYGGYAFIIEKNTENLIANSMSLDNYKALPDGKIEFYNIGEIEDIDIHLAYEKYKRDGEPYFIHKGRDETLYINVQEIQLDGIEWIIASAIPQSFLISGVLSNIYWTMLLVAAAVLLSIIIYHIVTGRLFKPMNSLLRVSESISSGNLSDRVNIVREDEIGVISKGLNKVADKMQYLINNLEDNVKSRTRELQLANDDLESNKEQLQLILDSTAEAIYGIDLNGSCTFCNLSCIRMLGYQSQSDLIGKNMHSQIHYKHRDGSPFKIEECRINQSIRQGKGFEAEDEVFWRADGTCFAVAYHAYPQIKNNQVIGGVITFTDITERKKKEEEIEYLSCHDTLTGLTNRRCFEDNVAKVDKPENWPLSVIFADINGLKMTNDIFGHAAGDELIKKSAEILKQACRNDDVIARTGGDEFIILLPSTSKDDAISVMDRIRQGFASARVAAIKCSMALGADTKTRQKQSLEEIMSNAENEMYKDKTLTRGQVNREIIDTIVDTLHAKSDRERQHSINVSLMCAEFGEFLGMPPSRIDKLKRAGYLHDIGKITLDEELLSMDILTDEEFEEMRQHSVISYRILNLFDDTLDLAEYVYGHHERWDGKGYPRGLQGENITMISRIIAIVETYERIISRGDQSDEEKRKIALGEISKGADTQFDPELARQFVKMYELLP
jgi:diguanylate cyclase (GGDEF)-like protein/PAS domain S-box-containing protein